MHAGIVLLSDIVDCKNAVACEVKIFEDPKHDLLPELTEWTLYNSDKLVEVDNSITVKIKRFEKSIDILGVNVESQVIDCLGKLVLIKSARAVVVHDFKAAS